MDPSGKKSQIEMVCKIFVLAELSGSTESVYAELSIIYINYLFLQKGRHLAPPGIQNSTPCSDPNLQMNA